jgi:signal transduction histidine kinase
VDVVVKDTDYGAEVAVIDQGGHLSPEVAARVFEPFFTTKPKGTGLGLAIAHRIVTAHDGTIGLAAHPPTGTRATVRLPRQPFTTTEPAR